ncbi:MAG: hypothetical protein LBI31_06850 [Zoogloeaceae bacterium]|jgi:uncharacterized protein|nr:hypothetical protein [Zoogloeaceae bacterium]
MSLFRLFILFLLGWIVWRLLRPSSRETESRPKKDAPETITACAWCGVYVPESEIITDRKGQGYCCQAHLSLAEAKKRPENR